MLPPLVHIGYPKTATTWLQKHLFANARAGFQCVLPVDAVDELLVFPNGLDFDVERCRQQFWPMIEESARQGQAPVISAERLSGLPHAGGCNSRELAERVAAVFPQARVLLVIREQRQMLASIYQQYVRAGGQCRLADYLSPPLRRRGKLPLFDFEHYCYHRLIACYVSRFGRDNVLVLPYELFQQAPVQFVERIVDFARAPAERAELARLPYAVKENPASAAGAIWLKRLLNILFIQDTLNPWVAFPIPGARGWWKRHGRRLERLIPARINQLVGKRMQGTITDLVGDRYRASNWTTSSLLDLDLLHFGYDM